MPFDADGLGVLLAQQHDVADELDGVAAVDHLIAVGFEIRGHQLRGPGGEVGRHVHDIWGHADWRSGHGLGNDLHADGAGLHFPSDRGGTHGATGHTWQDEVVRARHRTLGLHGLLGLGRLARLAASTRLRTAALRRLSLLSSLGATRGSATGGVARFGLDAGAFAATPHLDGAAQGPQTLPGDIGFLQGFGKRALGLIEPCRFANIVRRRLGNRPRRRLALPAVAVASRVAIIRTRIDFMPFSP